MNSFLSNLRLICTPSEDLGRDWYKKSLLIDNLLSSEGFDLAQENVYLHFSMRPDEVLEDLGNCLIARPVIGSKKEFKMPFFLMDWKAAPVWREEAKGTNLKEILESALVIRKRALNFQSDLHSSFYLCIQRSLKPELSMSVDVIFYE